MAFSVRVDTVRHGAQRYETCGDWYYYEGGPLEVRVSECGDWRYEALVAVHELVEMVLCVARGIKQEDVDKFDMEFEAKRLPGDEREPGDDEDAPYYREHQFATRVEKSLARELGVDWETYEGVLNALKRD